MVQQDYFEIKLQEKFEEFLSAKKNREELEHKGEPVNHYQLFVEGAKDDTLYEFEIWGLKQFYRPVFKVVDGKILSSCNCKAGIGNMSCWHRTYVLSGKTEYILNKNAASNLKMMAEAYSAGKAVTSINTMHGLKSDKNYGFRKAAFQTFFMLFTSIF